MDSLYSVELEIALSAVRKASQLSESILSANRSIEKADHTPVTIADFAVQALLAATIKGAYPYDTYVGEEDASELRQDESLLNSVWDSLSALELDDDRIKLPQSKDALCDLIDQCGAGVPGVPGSGRTWVFDPIDGTKTYMMGQVYAINVALLVNDEQTLSAVACPKTSIHVAGPTSNEDISEEGCVLFAAKGCGAHVRSPNGSNQRRLSPNSEASDIRFITSVKMADSALDGAHEAVAKELGTDYPGCDLLPWVLRWAMLAMGVGNTIVWVYKRLDRYAKVWDHAGAMLLFEEVGGKITDVRGKKIDFSAGRKMVNNYGFVAASENLHPKVLSAVHDVLKKQGRDDLL